MGRKSQTKDSDLSEVRRLRLENQKLKKQISRLRKMVSRHEDFVEEQIEVAEQEPSVSKKELARQEAALLKQWKCFACGEGTLLLLQITRPDGTFYKRKCSICKYSTRLKPHTPEIKGITNEQFKVLCPGN